MLDALSAEALKIRHHKATWFLVWLYPILFTLLFTVAVIVGLYGGDQRPGQVDVQEWIEDAVLIWLVPSQAIGRYLIAAFVAVVFAGEYGWNTWKLVVPHRSRLSLMAAKYAVVIGFFSLAFVATALISTVGALIEDWATGEATPAGVTLGLILKTQGTFALSAILPFFVTIGYASLAAVLTRSTIAALVIGIVAVTIEELVLKFGPIIAVKFPAVIGVLYPVLPGYHLANVYEWLVEGAGFQAKFPDGSMLALSLGQSVAVSAAWAAALIGLAVFAFRRQDIN